MVRGWGGVCGQNICYHGAAFLILFNLICNKTMFLKKLNFDLLTPRVQVEGANVVTTLHSYILDAQGQLTLQLVDGCG